MRVTIPALLATAALAAAPASAVATQQVYGPGGGVTLTCEPIPLTNIPLATVETNGVGIRIVNEGRVLFRDANGNIVGYADIGPSLPARSTITLGPTYGFWHDIPSAELAYQLDNPGADHGPYFYLTAACA